jgi:hypothetical protein
VGVIYTAPGNLNIYHPVSRAGKVEHYQRSSSGVSASLTSNEGNGSDFNFHQERD